MPGIGSGEGYKFHIRGADGEWHDKADPMAYFTEVPPATASRVFASTHTWTDDEWMAERSDGPRRPAADVGLRGAPRAPGASTPAPGPYTYDELAEHLTAYVVEMGFTHVELLPVMEHPFGGSWGYQVTSYYAPTSRFGDPDGFRRLVQALHNAGIGVIVDWVPGALPQGRVRAGPLRRHPALRGPEPEPRGAPRLGHLRLQLRAQGGAQLPGRQRALLARGVPHRRHPGRRRRLDALPRLLPQGRASGSPTSAVAGRTSRRCTSSRS